MAVAGLQAVLRHPHLANAQRPNQVRVDMHVHSLHSGDSTSTFTEIVDATLDAGMDVVCLTDHHAVKGSSELARVLSEHGVRVICGEEIRTHTGELIGLFIESKIPFGMTARDTAKAIRDQGGIVYVPHPFDPMRRNITEESLRDLVEDGLVDALEVINAKTSLSSLNVKSRDFATTFQLAAGAGSDAHVPLAIGAACVEMGDFNDANTFLNALHNATPLGHHWDEPRPWAPRIVPAT